MIGFQVDALKEGLSSAMSADAYLKESVACDINVGMLPNLLDIESMFQECATKDYRDFWVCSAVHVDECQSKRS